MILLDNLNSIHTTKDYGMVLFHFDKIMDKRGVRRNTLARLTGIRFEVANRLYQGKIERLDMDVLARVCFVLNCKIEDVLEYVKPSSEKN